MKNIILNYTPHPIVIGDRTIASNGTARVAVTSEVVGKFDGVEIYASSYGEVEGLPYAERDGVKIVVSRLVAAASNRADLLVPSGLVRDDKGRVIGCLGLEVAR